MAMRFVTSLADRVISAVVPGITAGACCPPDNYREECYCRGSVVWAKNCSTNCACKAVCGACYRTNIGC
jgi:hypothetical protein